MRAPAIGEPSTEPARVALTLADLEALEQQRAEELRRNPKKWRHNGLVVDFQLGTAGCFRAICRSSETGHQAGPGVHVGGFLGGNLLGLVEFGLEAGWNTLRTRGAAGQNALSLYGIDPVMLQQQIAERQPLTVIEADFSQLIVDTARSRAFNIGPSLRIHFLRKGRGLAYIGSGLHYQMWRTRYETLDGPLRLDFHGLSAPFKIGGGAYVHPNIAVTGEFTYTAAFYVLAGVNHPEAAAVAPLAVVDSSAVDVNTELRKGLPHFGKFTVNLRFRF